MKRIIFKAFLATAFICAYPALTSCDAGHQENTDPSVTMQKPPAYPDNPVNPYDAAGQLYYAVSEAFIDSGVTCTSSADAIATAETFANANADFLAVKPGSYTAPLPVRIDYFTSCGSAGAQQVIANAGMTVRGQQRLSSFLTNVMGYNAATDYGTIYTYIIDFEASIVADHLLTSLDTRVILSTSAIARHGLYLKKKKRRRDRDWDISWGNITAGAEGSTADMAKAVVMSVATAIQVNK